MEKQNFISDLHLACAKDKSRPNMQCVHFLNGYAYASDSHILIKQSLELNNQVVGYELLECKSIHKESFKEIRKFDIVEVTEDGFDCTSEGRKAFFPFTNIDVSEIPDFDSIIPKNSVNLSEIGVSPRYIGILEKAMAGGNKIKMHFTGVNTGILFTSLDADFKDQVALIMPQLLGEGS